MLFALFATAIAWMLWASTARYWAVWAGAHELGASSVAVATTASGAWGDSFGGFNAFFGALGAFGVIGALLLQFQSLKEQRTEQHISRFEENFFRLIGLMREIRSEIKFEHTAAYLKQKPEVARKGIISGSDAIQAAFFEVNFWAFKLNPGVSEITRRQIAAQYENFVHSRYENYFAPYYRIIYTILSQIRNDKVLTEKQKADFGNILRAQLGGFETGLLAFNATSSVAKNLNELIVYFRLLKYLPQKRRRVFSSVFPNEAYEARPDYSPAD